MTRTARDRIVLIELEAENLPEIHAGFVSVTRFNLAIAISLVEPTHQVRELTGRVALMAEELAFACRTTSPRRHDVKFLFLQETGKLKRAITQCPPLRLRTVVLADRALYQ